MEHGIAEYVRKIKGQHHDGQQDRESPRGKCSSESLREDLRKPLKGSLCDLVYIASVPLGGFQKSCGGLLRGRFPLGDSRSCCRSSCYPLIFLQDDHPWQKDCRQEVYSRDCVPVGHQKHKQCNSQQNEFLGNSFS